MGWGDCGTDSKGRPIGYLFPAICDEPGCGKAIDRGLAYACGGMHGENDGWDCEGYFCPDHLTYREHPDTERYEQFCRTCAMALDFYAAHPDQDPDYSAFLAAHPEVTPR